LNAYRSELQAIALIVGIAIVAAFGAVVGSAGASPPLAQPATLVPTAAAVRPTPAPSVVAGALDGLPTPRLLAERRPLAVVIDNFYPDARPQTGLSRASVVFEALTEGGITRLMALFLEHDPGNMGPVRSARPYFVSWAAGFRAIFVHAGGAPAALQMLRRTPSLADLDALQTATPFSRASDRVAPHNLYTTASGARALAVRRGEAAGTPTSPFVFTKEAPLAARGHSSSFQITFSTPQVFSPPAYTVSYRYARRRNEYLRSQGGVPFIDRATGAQIAPSNVIVLFTKATPILNDPAGRIALGAVGEGRATLFQNGHEVHGSWSKASTSSPLFFTRTDGSPMKLVPGQTWIEVAPPGDLRVTAAS
jgi:hypothetical protein